MGKILWLIVLIVVVVALYNTFTHLSGSFKFENLAAIIRLPGAPSMRTTTTVSVPALVSTGGAGSAASPTFPTPPEPTKPQIVPPDGFTVSQLSPYYGQVRINSVSSGNFPNLNQFSLGADYSLKTPIDITGWSLKSKNRDVLIPKAVSNYDPSGFSMATDIAIGNGQYVNFYNTASPILTNLRLNECTGYLNNTYKFTPALPNNCSTSYSRSEIASFSGSCQDMITSLWGCSEPTEEQLSSDQSCRSFLTDRFNYSGCYKYHRGDADFLSSEWDVWLNGSMYFENHDLVLLFDGDGLLVNQYSY